MRWVTRELPHIDRVATPWLIRRFVDGEAEFVFIAWQETRWPDDAIPFAVPGADLGPHDAGGTTFDKVLARYPIREPALDEIATVVRRAVDHVLHHYVPPPDDHAGQIAVGLAAIAEGMLLCARSDAELLAASFPIYDALYAQFRAQALVRERGLELPATAGEGPRPRVELLRALLASEPVAGGRT
jgi:hypothetical protein